MYLIQIANKSIRNGSCVQDLSIINVSYSTLLRLVNKHDLELTLLWQINTLQTLRYLANGGLEDQEQHSAIFTDIMMDPKLKILLSGWCIDSHNLTIHNNNSNENESLNDDDDEIIFILYNMVKFILNKFCQS